MIAIFQGIYNFLSAIGGVVVNLLVGIYQMIIMIPSALSMLLYSVGYMPSVILAFAVAMVTVSVVYMVIGR